MLRKIQAAIDPRELLYPSNILSLVRLALIWPTVRYLLKPGGNRKALALIAAGMATDFIDGPLARARGEVSGMGKVLDPIADKLTLDGVAIALSLRHGFPRWITYLLLIRDIGIVAGSTLIFRRSEHITTSVYSGKVATATLTGALLLYILDYQPWGRRLLDMAMVALCISWAEYTVRLWQWVRTPKA